MYLLDAIDRKLLRALDEQPRISYVQLGKAARVSKEVAHYRVKRLMDEGVIREFVTIFGLGYWPHKVLVSFSHINAQQEQEVITYLSTRSRVNWVTPCTGMWDLVFVIMAKDPKDFDVVFQGIMKRIGKHVREYSVATSLGSHTYGHKYVLGTNTASERWQNTPNELDAADRKIARLLLRDARAKYTEIARGANISVDAVAYRIRRMQERGVIKRYRTIIDPYALGYQRFEVFVRSNDFSVIERQLQQFGHEHQNVEYYSRCTGGWDAEMTVNCKDAESFRTFILELKSRFGQHLVSVQTLTLFRTQNYTYLLDELA